MKLAEISTDRRSELTDRTNTFSAFPRGDKSVAARKEARHSSPSIADDAFPGLELCFELNELLDHNKQLIDTLDELRSSEQQLARRTEHALEQIRALGLEEMQERNSHLTARLAQMREDLALREAEVHNLAAQNALVNREIEDKNRLMATQQSQIAELDRKEAELRAVIDMHGAELSAMLAREKAMQEQLIAHEHQANHLRQQHQDFLSTKANIEQMLSQTPVDGLADEVEMLRENIARVENDNRKLLEALGGITPGAI